jgi:AbrB family looped-hinge helix DNA binding protein
MLKTYYFDSTELFSETSNSEEVILQIPDEICEELKWKEGDTLIVTIENDSIILRKKNNNEMRSSD